MWSLLTEHIDSIFPTRYIGEALEMKALQGERDLVFQKLGRVAFHQAFDVSFYYVLPFHFISFPTVLKWYHFFKSYVTVIF